MALVMAMYSTLVVESAKVVSPAAPLNGRATIHENGDPVVDRRVLLSPAQSASV